MLVVNVRGKRMVCLLEGGKPRSGIRVEYGVASTEYRLRTPESWFLIPDSGFLPFAALACSFVACQRHEWKVERIHVIFEVKHLGKAGAGELRFVPAAVGLLRSEEISNTVSHRLAVRF